MNYFDDPVFLRQIIMDHYENPRNKGIPKDVDSYQAVHMKTDSCIDDLTIYVLMKDGVVEDLAFSGVACTISTSSTSIMSELLQGKTREEALVLIEEFDKMMRLENYDDEAMQEANAFKNVGRQANRISCARLGWQGVLTAIKGVVEDDS